MGVQIPTPLPSCQPIFSNKISQKWWVKILPISPFGCWHHMGSDQLNWSHLLYYQWWCCDCQAMETALGLLQQHLWKCEVTGQFLLLAWRELVELHKLRSGLKHKKYLLYHTVLYIAAHLMLNWSCFFSWAVLQAVIMWGNWILKKTFLNYWKRHNILFFFVKYGHYIYLLK